ncbi:MAG: ribonuclease PH [bacterium]|jgi:ribonuclease PH|nr:ribonuclease PH [bacterium]
MQTNFTRGDGRLYNQLRNLSMERNFLAFAEGSCLVSFGRTKVICTASIEDKVPSFLAGSKQGWITAEYGMLPKSTKERMNRDRGFNGRNQEIQRLIGRSLRCVTNLDKLGERTIYIDCDVIQADGGTRTASISGAMVALHDALSFLKTNNLISEWPIKEMAAAVSVGIVDGRVCLDLDYSEDSVADVDFNVVQTESGQYVELQGTAEHHTFSNPQLLDLLTVAGEGIQQIVGFQKSVLGIV